MNSAQQRSEEFNHKERKVHNKEETKFIDRANHPFVISTASARQRANSGRNLSRWRLSFFAAYGSVLKVGFGIEFAV